MTAAVVTPADILNGAAALIAERGKAKACYQDHEGRLCAAGAMRLWALGDPYAAPEHHPDPVTRAAYTAAHQALRQRILKSSWPGIASWNDNHATSAEQVVAEMRATAMALAAAGPEGASE